MAGMEGRYATLGDLAVNDPAKRSASRFKTDFANVVVHFCIHIVPSDYAQGLNNATKIFNYF
jgi:hypothetical protein